MDRGRGEEIAAAHHLRHALHRIILDEAGRKLAKSLAATSLRLLRQQGLTAADIRTRIGPAVTAQ